MAKLVKLNDLSIDELLAEVQRRKKALPRLMKQKAKFEKQLAEVEAEIQALGGDEVKTGKAKKGPQAAQANRPIKTKRLKNTISLMDALLQVLEVEKAKTIPDIVTAVAQKGYQSNSRNFSLIVRHMLSQNPDKFIRVARGKYAKAE